MYRQLVMFLRSNIRWQDVSKRSFPPGREFHFCNTIYSALETNFHKDSIYSFKDISMNVLLTYGE